jgi:N-acetyl-anhydromuramyl-L-alanine amidase AmpD
MQNKRGQTEIPSNILIGAIAAFFLIIAMVVAINAFSDLLSPPKVSCINEKWFDSKYGLTSLLESIDSNEATSGEFFFFNGGCSLASFDIYQGISPILYDGLVSNQPILCLCKLKETEDSSRSLCEPNSCYKFNNIARINDRQFSTSNKESYVGLKFVKDGNTLRIDALSKELKPTPIQYKISRESTSRNLDGSEVSPVFDTKTENYKVVPYAIVNQSDPFIQELVIRFKTSDIQTFIPVIEVKELVLRPIEVPFIQDFTKFFKIDLGKKTTKILLPREEYAKNYEIFTLNNVEESLIKIIISKQNYDKLTLQQKNSIKLFYKRNDNWASSKMLCKEVLNNNLCSESKCEIKDYVLCELNFLGFSNDFAISATEVSESNDLVDKTYLGDLNQFTQSRTVPVTTIVLHHTGPTSDANAVITTLKQRQLSVHYIIDRDGKIYQAVSEDRVAYHANCNESEEFCRIPNINSASIGIELVNSGHISENFDAIYPSLKKLLQDITQRNGIPYDDQHIIGHYEITRNKYDPSPNFDWSKIGLSNHATFYDTYPGVCLSKEDWGGVCPTEA